MKIVIIFMCIFTISHFPQEKMKKPVLYLPDKTSYKLDKVNFSLPVWIAASETTVNSVHLEIPNIISSDGRVKEINYKIDPDSTDISVSTAGKLFKIKFDPLEIEDLDSGTYSLLMIISGANTEPFKEVLSFEIVPAKSAFVWLEEGVNWILNNFFTLLWNLIQVVLLIFVFIFVLKMIYSIFKKRNTLNVLPIVNETGEEGEYKGAAEGIDDILIYRLQEISKLSGEEVLEKYRLSSSSGALVEKENVQILNVVGGEFSMDLEKIGDVSIGPVKIPLGSMSNLILKLFGGNYVSGALQKYGSHNKLYIRLDRKPSVLSFSRKQKNILSVQYFEANWISNTVKNTNLTEGIPDVVDELAYKLILELSKDAGTSNWMAYKYFLDGYKLFSDFEKNKTRIDLLRDAISIWRESIKFDPDFATAHYNLGVAYDMDENTEDAIFRYQKAISLNPELIGAEAHFNLARLFLKKYKDETRTLAELEKAKKLDPHIPDIYNLEGLVYSYKTNSYSKESELYQKAIDLSGQIPNPIFYYNLCIAKFYLKKLEEAQSAGERAYQLMGEKEKLTGLFQTMGIIHYQKGINAEKINESNNANKEFEKSVKYYGEGLLKYPSDRVLLKGYRDALFKLERINDGMEILRRLIRLYPEVPDYYIGLSEYLKAANIHADEIKIYEQISTILQRETDPLKSSEALQKENGSLQQTKLYKGILASIFHVLYDPQKNLGLLDDSLAIFNEIFQPQFDNTKTMIDAELLHHFGMVLYKLGNYEESIEKINQAILIYIKDERCFDLAQAYSDLAGGYTKLIEILFPDYISAARKIVNLKEKDELAKYITEADNLMKGLLNTIDRMSLQADLAFQNASFYFKKGNFHSLAVSAHLDNAEFLLKKESYRIYGDTIYELAKQECDKAIQIDHKDYYTFLVKGLTFYDPRQYSKAIPEFEKSVELNFNLPGTHYNIGLCYFYMGEYEKANKAFQTVIKLDPKYTSPDDMQAPDAYQRLVESLEKLGDLTGAVKILTEAGNIHPDKVKYHILLGQLLKRRNDLGEAATEFQSALDLDIENLQNMRHIALREQADIYADNGADINKAKLYIEEAKIIIEKLDATSKNKEIFKIENTEGWILYNLNQPEMAVILLEKTLVDFLDDPKYHSRLAYSYEKYAHSLSDLKLKEEYKNKSLTQWEIISNLKGNERYKKIAEEKLEKI